MSVLEKAKNLLANNGKVTIQEKGNPYDVWVFSLTPSGIEWVNTYNGKNGKIKDLSEFCIFPEFDSELVIAG